ncbi:MAG TPA: CRTAC1 family protein [Thermoanaerobaculia bacterium]|nr:CRTAC1 family protein [Thermoanaerobaculia bacterium]
MRAGVAGRGQAWCRDACLLLLASLAAGCGPSADREHLESLARRAPLFVDVAPEVGLDFVHFNGMSGELYYAEIMGAGAALFDYDGDGDLDAFLVQGEMLDTEQPPAAASFPPRGSMLPLGSRLYRNELVPGGRLRFTDVTAASGLATDLYGMGVAVGDVDANGHLDLFVTGLGSCELWLARGDGTFRNATGEAGLADPRWGASASFLDFDLDGRLDLYVTGYLDFAVERHHLCKSMTGEPDYCPPWEYPPQHDRLLRNRGDGRFEDVSAAMGITREARRGMGVVAGDWNGDGWPDLYVSNDGDPNSLWLNREGQRFEDVGDSAGAAVAETGSPKAGMGLAVGDPDGDGDEDLLVTNLALQSATLFRLDGSGPVFTDATKASGLEDITWAGTGFGTAFLDADNDGWLDLLVVNGGIEKIPSLAAINDPFPLRMPKRFAINVGGGRFRDASPLAGPAITTAEVSRGVALGDLDNDGDTDVLVTNNAGPARLLENRAGQDSHWLGLRLVGRGGGDAVGARVEVRREGGPPLVRRSRTDGSYLTSSDPRVLFGLGASTAAVTVVVEWPGGGRESFAPPLDRYTTLVEGTGLAEAHGGPP